MNLYDLDGKYIPGGRTNFEIVRPSLLGAAKQYYLRSANRCDLVFIVSRDRMRVFVGGGQWGYDSIAREIDALGIEVLAERYQTPELMEVLNNLKSKPKYS